MTKTSLGRFSESFAICLNVDIVYMFYRFVNIFLANLSHEFENAPDAVIRRKKDDFYLTELSIASSILPQAPLPEPWHLTYTPTATVSPDAWVNSGITAVSQLP